MSTAPDAVSNVSTPGSPPAEPPAPPARRSPRLSEDEIWEFVTDAHTGTMTTLRRDGMPIALPLWYVVVDRQIYTTTRGKKLLRLAHDPRASFLVETGKHWGELVAVHFTGTAEVVELDATPGLSEQVHAENERKYANFRVASSTLPSAVQSTYSNLMKWVRFTPQPGARVLSWDNARLL